MGHNPVEINRFAAGLSPSPDEPIVMAPHPDHLAFRKLLKQAESDPVLAAEIERLMGGRHSPKCWPSDRLPDIDPHPRLGTKGKRSRPA